MVRTKHGQIGRYMMEDGQEFSDIIVAHSLVCVKWDPPHVAIVSKQPTRQTAMFHRPPNGIKQIRQVWGRRGYYVHLCSGFLTHCLPVLLGYVAPWNIIISNAVEPAVIAGLLNTQTPTQRTLF